MNTIGFKTTEQLKKEFLTVLSDEKVSHNLIYVDDLIKQKGFEKAIVSLEDYFNESKFPLLHGEQREQWLMSKITKIKNHYFDSI